MDNNNRPNQGAPFDGVPSENMSAQTPRGDAAQFDATGARNTGNAAAPQQNTPRQSAPQQSAPRQSSPQQSVLQQSAPRQISPQQGVPSRGAQNMPNNPAAARRASVDANGATRKIDTPKKDSAVVNTQNGKKSAKNNTPATGSNTLLSVIKCVVYIAAVLVVSTIISLVVIFAANDIYAFSKSDESVQITIPEGADLGDLADILRENGVIKYKGLFKMKNKGVHDIKAGEYTVSPSMSYDKLISEFREKVPTGVSWITIPEGYTTDEIIDLFVESGIGEREAYVDVINNYDFDYWFIDELGEDWDSDGRIYRLDGYLFPDTYQFYNASSEITVVNKLLSRFEQVFVKSYKERAAELGYSVDEILTLASIIEKEAASQAEFSDVSSVFHNRLNNPATFPCLESDATVVYSIQHETGVRPNLTSDDLNRDDPYNSYKVSGLVPGPIANPSNSAILAALNPKNTNYYYFVSNGKTTYFAATLEEHNANRAKYLAPNANAE